MNREKNKGHVTLQNYFPVYIYFALVMAVTGITLLVSSLFKAKNPVATKYLPYESGIKTKTELFSHRYFLRHYLVALIFLVFDIEVVFLYPWAVVAKEIGTFAFYEIVFFIGTSVIGLAYIWKKGGLKWE